MERHEHVPVRPLYPTVLAHKGVAPDKPLLFVVIVLTHACVL
jgi:hypothetical protein